MKILVVNLSAVRFTVITPETEPLGGTESCIAYLAGHLAQLGHDITLVAQIPLPKPALIRGVYHYGPETLKEPDFLIKNAFDIIIVCNTASLCPLLKELSPTSALILWDHVPPDQPSITDLGNVHVFTAIDRIVYVSDWQKQETERYFKFEKEAFVIGNGLTPAFENMFSSPAEILRAKKNEAAYTTIPYRGLSILLKVMTDLKEETELKLFSSMRVYQLSDDKYVDLYHDASHNPRISSHGSVAQPLLAQHLKETAFLAYPCIMPETFCIGALEALAAGLKVISTNLGALPTTTMGYADLIEIPSSDANDLIIAFGEAMKRNIHHFLHDPVLWSEERFDQIQAVHRQCLWPLRALDWQRSLQNVIQK